MSDGVRVALSGRQLQYRADHWYSEQLAPATGRPDELPITHAQPGVAEDGR